MSGALFYAYYVNTTYEVRVCRLSVCVHQCIAWQKWTRKSNPTFPKPEMVRAEIVQMIKGIEPAAITAKLTQPHRHAQCNFVTHDFIVADEPRLLQGVHAL